MKKEHFTKTNLEEVAVEGAKNTKIRWLISEKDAAKNFFMRMFEVAPAGFTPYHKHNWEHEIFVVEGDGKLITEKDEQVFSKGDVMFINPDSFHQFRNTGDSILKFLCIIPNVKKAKKNNETEKKMYNPFASGSANNC